MMLVVCWFDSGWFYICGDSVVFVRFTFVGLVGFRGFAWWFACCVLSGVACGSWVCVVGCGGALSAGWRLVVFISAAVVGSFGYGWRFGGGLFLHVSFLGRFYGIVFYLLRRLCLIVDGFGFGLDVCFLGLTIVLVFV